MRYDMEFSALIPGKFVSVAIVLLGLAGYMLFLHEHSVPRCLAPVELRSTADAGLVRQVERVDRERLAECNRVLSQMRAAIH